MKKRFLLVIMALCVAVGLKAQEASLRDTVAYPYTNQSTALISTTYNYAYSQSIYLSSEVSQGILSNIGWYLTGNSAGTRTIQIEILIGETSESAFTSETLLPTANLTSVYSGPFTIESSGWHNVDFQIPYVYTGINNLVVAVKSTMGNWFYGPTWGMGGEFSIPAIRTLYAARDSRAVTPEDPAGVLTTTLVPSAVFTRLPEGSSICLPVDDITFSNTDQISTTIAWSNPNGEGTTFSVSYRPEGGEFIQVGTTNDTTFQLTGLTSSSVYEVQILANCGEQQSFPTLATFNTACSPVESFPWTEDFATNFVQGTIGSTVPNHCWININGGSSTYRWGGSATRGALWGYFSSDETSTNSDWLIFPAMEFTGMEAVKFSIDKTEGDNIEFDIYVLDVTNGDITSEADTANFTYVATVTSDANTPSGETFQVLLSEIENTSRLAFVNKKPNPYFYIPEVVVEQVDCPNVYGFNAIVSNVDAIQVNLNTLNHEGSGWVIAYGTADSLEAFNPATASTVTVNDAADFPYLIQGLTAGTTYYVSAKQNCGGEFTTPKALTLPQPGTVAMVPYTQNFDGSDSISEIQFTNATSNAWILGTATNNPSSTEGRAIYISNDNGVTNAYTLTTESRNYFSTLVAFPTDGSVAFRIKFDWKCNGEGSYDYLQAFLVPADYELSHSNAPANRYKISDQLSNSSVWNTKEAILDAAGLLGTMQKLVFMWRNDDAVGNIPPAAVDNIVISSLSCIAPASVAYERTENASEMIINITSSNPSETTYQIEYKPVSAEAWASVTTTELTTTLSDLELGTEYEYKVAALCDGELTNYVNGTFVTMCAPIQDLPYTNTFSGIFASTGIGINGPLCWINLSSESNFRWSTYSQTVSEPSLDGTENVLAYNGDSYADSRPIVSEWLFTPAFDFDGEQRLQFEARLHYETEREVTLDIFALNVSENDLTSVADTANATYITSVNIAGNTWRNKEVLLANVNTTSRLAFAVRHNAAKFYIDNLRINQAPPCPDVQGLTATTPDGSSLVVNFDTIGAPNGWIVAYTQTSASTSSSFDPETATQITIPAGASFPFTIATNVNGGNYTIAVKQNCDGAYWTYPVNVFVPIVNQIPYSENFDNAESIDEWSVTAPNPNYASSDNKWCYGTAVNNTTDEAGNLTTGGAYYVSNDNGVTNNYSASYTISTLSTYLTFGDDLSWELSFDWKCKGENGYDYMEVYLLPLGESLPTTYNSFYKIGQNQYNRNEEWLRESIILGEEYANGVYQLVFFWINDSYVYDPAAAVDNIEVNIRSCFEISNLTAVASEGNDGMQAVISFNDTINQGASYLLEYKLSDASTWSSVSGITNPYTLTGLQPGAEYYVRVKTICSETASSQFVSTSFNTPCANLTAPWAEGFETGAYNTSDCWYYANGVLAESSNLQYITDNTWGLNNEYIDYNGTSKMYYNLWGSNKHKWVITPTIDLGETNTQLYEFSFDIAAIDWQPTGAATFEDDDKIAVVVSTDNGLTWSSANAVVFANADEDTEHNLADITTSFTRKTMLLQDASGAPLSGLIKIGIYASTEYGNSDLKIFLDNFEVNLAGTTNPCAQPTSLVIEENNITANTAVLSWTAGANECGWEVRLGENGTIENATIPFVTFYDLTPNTTYTAYVRAVCNAANRSEWDSIQFTTLEFIPCDAPTELTASNVTATTAEVTWNGTAESYELRVNAQFIGTVTETNKTITNLNPNSSYTVDVRAICGEQTSEWVSVSFITPISVCDAPTDLSASNITETSAEIIWNGTAESYEIRVNGGEAETITATSKSLSDLTPATAYTVEVRAICGEQTSEWVSTNFTTLEEQVVIILGEVTTLSATNVGNTSATLNGAFVNAGNSENYTVGFALATTADFTLETAGVENVVATLTDNAFSQDVTDLAEGQTYFFRAYITNEAGTAYGAVETFTLSSLADAMANALQVSVYPNPATTQATLKLVGLQSDAKIVISDLQGRILSQDEISASTTTYTIDLNNIASGVYYIRVVSDNAISTQKLIVE